MKPSKKSMDLAEKLALDYIENMTNEEQIAIALLIDEDREELIKVLQGIIDGCVHPDIAVRAALVDLAPIRKILKKYE
jgi:hypothetical protein